MEPTSKPQSNVRMLTVEFMIDKKVILLIDNNFHLLKENKENE